MNRLIDYLYRLTGLSALPAHLMTYAVVAIWVFGAGGLSSAAKWWAENAGTTTTFVTLVLGSWLAYKGVGKISDAKHRKGVASVENPGP